MIVTIDTEVLREKYESHRVLADRLDRALTLKINELQQTPTYKNWDLLSVVQTGGEFPTGFFTTTWEYDDEYLENTDVLVDEVSFAQDGDTTPHVRFGEVIRVNDVRFQLVSVSQDGSGSYIEFLEESAMHLENQDVEHPRGYTHIQAQAAANRGERLGGRYGRGGVVR
jgi:hypothetical protein